MSDPGSTYRTRDEINAMRQQRDPVERVKKLLLDNGGWAAGLMAFNCEDCVVESVATKGSS
jgi:TPP-dependent pyruvate/acetoin dehydrogenase alpha subunit